MSWNGDLTSETEEDSEEPDIVTGSELDWAHDDGKISNSDLSKTARETGPTGREDEDDVCCDCC